MNTGCDMRRASLLNKIAQVYHSRLDGVIGRWREGEAADPGRRLPPPSTAEEKLM